MNLKSIHILLTYRCNFECDHCFLYCSPRSSGTFTISQIKELLNQVKDVPTINSIGFEGGEPFLYYPVLVEAVRLCSEQGLPTSIQTNNFWATTREDALLWLKPLDKVGLNSIDISQDEFHHGKEPSPSVENAMAAAQSLNIKVKTLCIKPPEVSLDEDIEKGEPIYLGGPKLRGRAIDKLVEELPTKDHREFKECPYEDLQNPSRVHLDAYGNLHLCQGLSMGNIWEQPLIEILNRYDPGHHPITGPLLEGGPANLAKIYGIEHDSDSVDACHFCSRTCLSLIDRFPKYLTPKQVYGL